jgi:hypothetical protein
MPGRRLCARVAVVYGGHLSAPLEFFGVDKFVAFGQTETTCNTHGLLHACLLGDARASRSHSLTATMLNI